MLRLIEADLASAGKTHPRDRTPWCLLRFGAPNAFAREGSHLSFQIVAHEEEFVDSILLRRVECGLGWRQGEDQPAITRIHGSKPKDVAKKCAVRLGVLAVDDYVSARNQLPLLIRNSDGVP